jgi:hypothetical protein
MLTPRARRAQHEIGAGDLPPTDVGPDQLFVWNYRIVERDVADWHMVSSRQTVLPTGVCVGRTMWQRPGGAVDDLLLIESYECPDREVAQELLFELVATFHMPRDFTRSPDAAAGFELVDAEGSNALLAIGNLVLRASSAGSRPVPAELIVQQLVERVAARPEPTAERAPRATSAASSKRLAIGDRAVIRSARQLAPRGGDAEAAPTLKLFTRGGRVRVVGDELVFEAEQPGEAEIESFAVDADERGPEVERMRVAVEEP